MSEDAAARRHEAEVAVGRSDLEGVVRPCWLMHQWCRWVDTHKVTKESTIHGGTIASGVQQERRCLRCNKLQLRIVWA